MVDKLEELKLAYDKATTECESSYREYNSKLAAKEKAQTDYERELYKSENCSTCKYDVISDLSPGGDHNLCGCDDAPCTCCHSWCENYQPDTPLTKAIKDLHCYIGFAEYKGLKNFYADILTTTGSINPTDKDYNPIAKTLYNILKARQY